MDNIVLDTNIFITENFLHGKKINSLLSLSKENKIKLYITEITYNELKNNFEKFLINSTSNHNKFKKDAKNWILQNDEDLQSFFVKIDATKIKNNFDSKLRNLIDDSVIQIIPYESMNIESVFNKYFNSEPPFGKGEKKSEFPDAFTLELTENFFKKQNIKAIVFSIDKDLLNSKFPSIVVRNDYQSYLEDIYTEMQEVKTDLTKDLFNSNSDNLKQHFINWYEDNLEDHNIYYNAVDWKEIYDVEIIEINVGELDYKIIEILENVVTIEIETRVKVKVNVLTDDDEYMYYDNDDRSYHYLETNYESFEKEFDSSMIASIEIIDTDNYFTDFVIESINDNKDISFNIEHDYR
jgi:hypothetical protein